MQVQQTVFDAWQAIKKNQSTVDVLKNRIAQRRIRFKQLCDGTDPRDAQDEVMVQLPDVELLDDDGTQKLLTVLEAETVPMSMNFLKEKCCLDSDAVLHNSLQKLSYQSLITLKTSPELNVVSIEAKKINSLLGRFDKKRKRRKLNTALTAESAEFLLNKPSAIQSESKKLGEEIQALLNHKSAREKTIIENLKSNKTAQVREFCEWVTRQECKRGNVKFGSCKKLHFRKLIHSHTDTSLGDCSFLNTCFHMDTCKYVHYAIDEDDQRVHMRRQHKEAMNTRAKNSAAMLVSDSKSLAMTATTITPPQWIQCDIRKLDKDVIGKFTVIMADPPWDIHMELPYGTMTDDEMRNMGVEKVQDDGFIFLWVTGRAVELGRELLQIWGYDRVDDIIWVKTNQLQRLIRTGRTGHWINHGKEHCLVGVKGNPKNFNRGLDCDLIVSEVRDTSHKPDEIYGMIERLSPGTRKLELFGREHNTQNNWLTLGNQLDGVHLEWEDVKQKYFARYGMSLPF
ncbi:N6-adenosine-methyltransferase subunit METTL3-like [Bolinopsis microptera]|uniref:N6-adenosine-methyltransferase subunit METTL3-like n=1 Tax=Bolinopsis microptera TaxID=2820187 RepID=UPI003079069F